MFHVNYLCTFVSWSKAVGSKQNPGQHLGLATEVALLLEPRLLTHMQPTSACGCQPLAGYGAKQSRAKQAACQEKSDTLTATTNGSSPFWKHNCCSETLLSSSFARPRRCAPPRAMAQRFNSTKTGLGLGLGSGLGDQGLSLKRKLEAPGADQPGLKFPTRDAGPEVGEQS
jgi:hypothetical protein